MKVKKKRKKRITFSIYNTFSEHNNNSINSDYLDAFKSTCILS